ncbi:hypothetical protein Cgig2_001361 [Carnegiea gigantea]|uniref:Retrotransposon Copia-like N-terminal domain-containing protein n=1 Tax=Carnegiea gigantea TaxID=171969 RepID=A0A9Q1KTS4_9CARY|nr:hypothetical protein Cgig2_001361 [Carnegiea gigantea]
MSADRSRLNYADLQNPLFIHPSDGPGSFSVGEKLTGAENYRTWRRGMEIGLSILYVQSASAVWNYLQRRFSLSQGSRKYKLIKDVYSVKQDGHSVSKYYTVMRGIWEELNAMNELPRMTTIAEDVTRFLNALLKQQEELKLFFQFLNGLDEKYQSMRSQILIMKPLPPVDTACGMIQ